MGGRAPNACCKNMVNTLDTGGDRLHLVPFFNLVAVRTTNVNYLSGNQERLSAKRQKGNQTSLHLSQSAIGDTSSNGAY